MPFFCYSLLLLITGIKDIRRNVRYEDRCISLKIHIIIPLQLLKRVPRYRTILKSVNAQHRDNLR